MNILFTSLYIVIALVPSFLIGYLCATRLPNHWKVRTYLICCLAGMAWGLLTHHYFSGPLLGLQEQETAADCHCNDDCAPLVIDIEAERVDTSEALDVPMTSGH